MEKTEEYLTGIVGNLERWQTIKKKKKENAAISALQENIKIATQRTTKLAEVTGNGSIAVV